MDVYYAMTNYHLVSSLLHKINYNKNNSIIILSSFLTRNQPYLVENIKASKIFNDVIVYNEIDIDYTIKKFTKEKELEELKKSDLYVEKNIGKIIDNANDLYICSDFFSIGFYLIRNKIKYNYFEDGCGILSRKYMPMSLIEKSNPNRSKIVKELGCFGENDNVIKRYGSLKDQDKNYKNKKDVDFNVKELLKKLSKQNINKFLSIFNMKKINIKNEKVNLLLTMHYDELMSKDKQKSIYTKLIDYFTNSSEKLIIKPHPADTIDDYALLFPKSVTINRYMPSELFPYCIDKKFSKGVTCWSTAIHGLKSIIKTPIVFDQRIDETYVDMDKYYVIIKYLEQIKKDEIQRIKLDNVNEIQFNMLIEEYFKKYKSYYKTVDNEDFDIIITSNQTEYKDKKIINIGSSNSYNNCILLTKKFDDNIIYEFIYLSNFNDISFNDSKKMTYQKYQLNYKIVDKNNLIKEFRKMQNNYLKVLEQKDKQIQKKQQEIDNIYNELTMIKQSTSWKVTKILRVVMDKIRSFK